MCRGGRGGRVYEGMSIRCAVRLGVAEGLGAAYAVPSMAWSAPSARISSVSRVDLLRHLPKPEQSLSGHEPGELQRQRQVCMIR